MRSKVTKIGIALFVSLAFLVLPNKSGAQERALGNPILFLLGQEPFKTGAKEFIRYKYEVFNRANYPNALFLAAPALPPCGKNANSARTWVDIYDQSGKRLNGFCALKTSKDLEMIWFALPRDEVPPSWIYIEMNDRQTSTKYKSNLAETTL